MSKLNPGTTKLANASNPVVMKSVKVETVQKMLIELGFRGPTFRGAYIVFRHPQGTTILLPHTGDQSFLAISHLNNVERVLLQSGLVGNLDDYRKLLAWASEDNKLGSPR
jgi:predicted RNA binding protein YcfA (HicA-like mRNA interferase family)